MEERETVSDEEKKKGNNRMSKKKKKNPSLEFIDKTFRKIKYIHFLKLCLDIK
jgi:hypothetical protein